MNATSDMLRVSMQGAVAVIRIRLPSITEGPVIERLSKELLDVAEQDDVKSVVLDFKRVTQAATPVLTAVMKLRKALSSDGGKVALSRPSADLSKLVRMIRLHKLLPMHDTVEDAVRACQ